jgi:hypothetical protein
MINKIKMVNMINQGSSEKWSKSIKLTNPNIKELIW